MCNTARHESMDESQRLLNECLESEGRDLLQFLRDEETKTGSRRSSVETLGGISAKKRHASQDSDLSPLAKRSRTSGGLPTSIRRLSGMQSRISYALLLVFLTHSSLSLKMQWNSKRLIQACHDNVWRQFWWNLPFYKSACRGGAPQASWDKRRHRNCFQTRPLQAYPK